MDIQECLDKGLLKKEQPDPERMRKSVEVALHKLDRARLSLQRSMFEETLLNSYSSMFHAARSVLFRDGFREKSHFALFVYLKERYAERLERRFLSELNHSRLERHDISYGLDPRSVDKDEAEQSVKVATEFLAAIKTLLK